MQVDDPGFVNGQCDGVTQKFLLNGTVAVPGSICGGEDGFILLITETTGIDIREGVVKTAAMPEVFSPDEALVCENPNMGDRLAQDIGVWVTDDPMDLFENEAIEVTFDCGTSRSRTRGLSVFILDGFFDFGLGPTPDADAVTQAFVGLLLFKAEGLIAGVNIAKPALKRGDFVKLWITARSIRRSLRRDHFRLASLKLKIFQKFVDRADFDISAVLNNEGNLTMRRSSMQFTLDVKVRPFVH